MWLWIAANDLFVKPFFREGGEKLRDVVLLSDLAGTVTPTALYFLAPVSEKQRLWSIPILSCTIF